MVVAGAIFTIPALFMWGVEPKLIAVGMLAMLGGVLGILIMIPLRPYLIDAVRRGMDRELARLGTRD